MKFTDDECKEVSNVIKTVTNGCKSFLEYAPMMIFKSKEDEELVRKGLAILNEKVKGIEEAEHYDELKQYLRVKKIVKEYREKEIKGE